MIEGLLSFQLELRPQTLLQAEKLLEEMTEELGNPSLLPLDPLALDEVHLLSKHFAQEDSQLYFEFSFTQQGVVFALLE